MTTEKKTDTTSVPASSDNKVIFAPLGKYAIVAVIMVSIIVTTAIMLDKQLNTVEEKIAGIESETVINVASAKDEQQSAEAVVETEKTVESAKVDVYVTTKTKTKEQESTEVTAKAETTIETVKTDVYVTTETKTEAIVQAAHDSNSTPNTQEVATTENANQTRQPQFAINNMDKVNIDQQRQVRIDAFKLEQKQHMTEMFARIKTLESQQLNQYKAGQEKQIARLRERIAEQQKMIDALVLRNKDLFELRAANIERRQTNREQILNRI